MGSIKKFSKKECAEIRERKDIKFKSDIAFTQFNSICDVFILIIRYEGLQ